MATNPVLAQEPPGWEILVSHHAPSRLGRTFRVGRPGGKSIHVCARCTGQLCGVAAYLALFGAARFDAIPLFGATVQLGFALAPLPAAIDWLSQSLGRRESSNALRWSTGLLLGIAVTDLLSLLLLGRFEEFLVGVLVVGAYVGAIAAVLQVTGAWRTVVQEHFPGMVL